MSNPSNRHDGPSTSAGPLHIIATSAEEEQFQTALAKASSANLIRHFLQKAAWLLSILVRHTWPLGSYLPDSAKMISVFWKSFGNIPGPVCEQPIVRG
jgi:hypothetical protein